MGRATLVVAMVLLAAGMALAAPQVLIDTDFGAPGVPFSEISVAEGNRVTGSLHALLYSQAHSTIPVSPILPTAPDGCTAVDLGSAAGAHAPRAPWAPLI